MSSTVSFFIACGSFVLVAVCGLGIVWVWHKERQEDRELDAHRAEKQVMDEMTADRVRAQTRIDNLSDVQVAHELDKLGGPE